MPVMGTQIEYKGIVFKSEHEYAWARFFDHEGLAWEYEAIAFRDPKAPAGKGYTYTPDFALDKRTLFVEVKATFNQHFNKFHFCSLPLILVVGKPDRCSIHLIRNGVYASQRLTAWSVAYALARNGVPAWML